MSKVIILDTETTGVGKNDQIIELSYVEVMPLNIFRHAPIPFYETTLYNERFFPSVPIQPEATKVHGIQFRDLLGKRRNDFVEIPKDVEFIIGHNIQFDYRMLGKPAGVKLICTLNLSKKIEQFLDVKFESHKLDYLVEKLSDGQLSIGGKYHAAKDDIMKNIFVLQKFLEQLPALQSWGDLYALQENLRGKK